MDFVAATLGINLPTQSARCTVDKTMIKRARPVPFLSHRDSMLCLIDIKAHVSKSDDDDTASTVSCSDSFSSTSSVSFVEPLVTEVYFRPRTTYEEKQQLFYTEREYRAFRREYYLYGRQEPRDPIVQFSDNISVHVYKASAEKDRLYYSEADLKRCVWWWSIVTTWHQPTFLTVLVLGFSTSLSNH